MILISLEFYANVYDCNVSVFILVIFQWLKFCQRKHNFDTLDGQIFTGIV